MSETTHPEFARPEFARSEAKIISMAQAGNADAFGELYQLHMDAISRYIQRRVNEIDEVENLTQTVFVKAWQAIARYQPTKAPFRAWLYRIAGNTVIDYYRTRKETVDLDTQWALQDGKRSPEELIVAAERDESVRTAVGELRPAYRQVLSLRFLDERDYPETAQVLDRKVHAVRMLQHRALGAMRKVLSEEQVYWLVATAAALSLALGGGVATASEGALPGDLFYPVKRAVESARLTVADDTRDAELHMEFASRRVDELSQLWAAGKTEEMATSAALYADHVADILVSVSKLAAVDSDQSRRVTELLSTSLSEQAGALTTLVSDGAGVLSGAVDAATSAADEANLAMDELHIIPSREPVDEPADQGDQRDQGSVQPLDEIESIPLFVDASPQISLGDSDEASPAVPEAAGRTADARLDPEAAVADPDNDHLVESAAMAEPDVTNDRLTPQTAARHQDSDEAKNLGDQTDNSRVVSPPPSGAQRSAASAQPAVASQAELNEPGQPDGQRSDFETDAVDGADVDHSVTIPPLPNLPAPAIKPPAATRVDDMPRQDDDQQTTVVGADADTESDSLRSDDGRAERSEPETQSELEPPLRGPDDGDLQGRPLSPPPNVESNVDENMNDGVDGEVTERADRSKEGETVRSESRETDARSPNPDPADVPDSQNSVRPSETAPDTDPRDSDERRPDQGSTERESKPEPKEETASGSDGPQQGSDEPERRPDRSRG